VSFTGLQREDPAKNPLNAQNLHETKKQMTGFFTADVPMAQVLATRKYTWATADRRLGAGAPVFISPLAWLSNCTRGIDAPTARYNGEFHDGPTTTTYANHADNVLHRCNRPGEHFYSIFTGLLACKCTSNKLERNPVPVMTNLEFRLQANSLGNEFETTVVHVFLLIVCCIGASVACGVACNSASGASGRRVVNRGQQTKGQW